MADEPMVKLSGVAKTYTAPGGGEARRVLGGLDLDVPAGEALAVVGPSGCGKSTLLNLIGALDRPSAGSVTVAGQDLARLSERQLAAFRGRRVGFIFQLHHLLPQCTVLENVLLPTVPLGTGGAEAESRARGLLDRVGLSERADDLPASLSGGERQRAAVVRALINEPALLLADEPTGSLDRAAANELAALLMELNAEAGVTLIVVTHSLELAGRMGRVLKLRDGSLHGAEDGR